MWWVVIWMGWFKGKEVRETVRIKWSDKVELKCAEFLTVALHGRLQTPTNDKPSLSALSRQTSHRFWEVYVIYMCVGVYSSIYAPLAPAKCLLIFKSSYLKLLNCQVFLRC